MNQANIIDFTTFQEEPPTPPPSDELSEAIQELIRRLRESNPIKTNG